MVDIRIFFCYLVRLAEGCIYIKNNGCYRTYRITITKDSLGKYATMFPLH